MEQKTKKIYKGSIRGFTLLELLIVIGILAILATAAVLVLNPAELLRQARDSTRASDLAGINSTLGLYLSTVATPLMDNRETSQCAGNATERTYGNITNATSSLLTFPYLAAATNVSVSSTRNVNGDGWLPVNLNAMTGGAPLSNWPVDPSNTITGMLTYIYGCDQGNSTYVITAKFESEKYVTDLGLPSKDGGPDPGLYEVGTAPGLTISG